MKLNFPHNAANRIWGWMLAIDIAIMPGLFFYKLFFHDPQIGYIHLLATYRFGFAKRALVGTIVSWFADRVALWYVYAIGIVAWAVTLTLFIATFRKIYGLTEKNLALFVFVIGSPFFFKNFMYSIEYFDIYGCLVALIALLLPVSGIYPLAMAGACVGLILMHHLQFLLYIPTIGFIVLVRYGLLSGVSVGKVVYGLMLVLALSVVFVAAAYFGNMPIPHDAFLAYVTARASDTLDPAGTNIWYSTIQQEVRATWGIMWTNSMRFPIYAALIALHVPVARHLGALLGSLAIPSHRLISIAALAAISIGYLVIGAVVFDYSRWVSNWGVCMFMAMLAVRCLPSKAMEADIPIRPGERVNLVMGWTATAIPRVGITKPF